MNVTVRIAVMLLAFAFACAGRASAQSWPECRTSIQDMLATNTLAFWATETDGTFHYTMRIDSDRWEQLGTEGQDHLEALLGCSISAGGPSVPYSLSIRSAYSNRELARYHNGQREALD